MEEDDHEMEVPDLFTCPISLQIMRDPVTAITGITYDRKSIEQWLFQSGNTTCPVTKQPLNPNSDDLTPNHTLRRLIQAWSTTAGQGVDRIPTPKPPLDRAKIQTLIKKLLGFGLGLNEIANLASESHRNRRIMAEEGVVDAMFRYVDDNCRRRNSVEGLKEALETLRLIFTMDNCGDFVFSCSNLNSSEAMDCLGWVLRSDVVFEAGLRGVGLVVAEAVVEKSPVEKLSRMRPEFLSAIVGVLSSANRRLSSLATEREARSAIRIIRRVVPHGNQVTLAEAGAVEELVEAEITGTRAASRRRTEAVFGSLRQLCSCAEGRARMAWAHAGGLATVADRMGRVSASVDEDAVALLTSLARFAGTRRVVREMGEAGVAARLCVMVQVDTVCHVKDKARALLKAHSFEWKHSHCLANHRYPN